MQEPVENYQKVIVNNFPLVAFLLMSHNSVEIVLTLNIDIVLYPPLHERILFIQLPKERGKYPMASESSIGKYVLLSFLSTFW